MLGQSCNIYNMNKMLLSLPGIAIASNDSRIIEAEICVYECNILPEGTGINSIIAQRSRWLMCAYNIMSGP